jgi:hypothetical protein
MIRMRISSVALPMRSYFFFLLGDAQMAILIPFGDNINLHTYFPMTQEIGRNCMKERNQKEQWAHIKGFLTLILHLFMGFCITCFLGLFLWCVYRLVVHLELPIIYMIPFIFVDCIIIGAGVISISFFIFECTRDYIRSVMKNKNDKKKNERKNFRA